MWFCICSFVFAAFLFSIVSAFLKMLLSFLLFFILLFNVVFHSLFRVCCIFVFNCFRFLQILLSFFRLSSKNKCSMIIALFSSNLAKKKRAVELVVYFHHLHLRHRADQGRQCVF